MITPHPQTNANPKAKTSPEALGVKVGVAFVRITKSKNRKKTRFVVKLPKRPGGPARPRKTFSTLAEARAFANALINGQLGQQQVFTQLTPEQLRELTAVATLLKPFLAKLNIGLEQAIHEYLEAKALTPNRALASLVREHLDQPWVTKSRTLFSEAKEAFLESRKQKGCANETIRTLRYALEAFARQFNNPAVGDVTTAQLNQRIHRPNRHSRGNKTVYCGLHNFFGWMQRNGFLRPDRPTAMEAVESPIVKHTPPQIITVEEARRAIGILGSQADPEYLLVLVVGLFSGIRMDEMQRLQMKHVAPGERIHVPAEFAKTRKGRFMPILPVLDAWLRPFYKREGFLNSRLDPQIRIAKFLREAGIKWKRNWLRHSYCSYRLRATNDLLETSQESGNSPEILAKKYLELVTELQANAYFGLTPEACGIHDWPERVARFIKLNGECHQLAFERKQAQNPSQN